MKPTKKFGSASFHDIVINTTVADLKRVCGEPSHEQNDGSDKVNFEWEMETNSGKVFTIYDWKEYKRIKETAIIEFHIGGATKQVTEEALVELEQALNS